MVYFESDRIDKSEKEKIRILSFVLAINLIFVFKND